MYKDSVMLRTTLFFLLILPVCLVWSEIQSVSSGGPIHRELPAEQLPVGAGSPVSEPGRKNAGTQAGAEFQTVGVTDYLPAFNERLSERLTFPLSWLSGNYRDFNAWRNLARAKVMECLLAKPPSVPFRPTIVAEQDRGSYIARKVALNLTGDSRVLSFMLIPKGKGPFPAVLLLHDHGARFDIGKEKVIRPWDESPEKMKSAEEWVNQNYGGRFIGDELAKRGYVCFTTDALNWSDRGGAGFDGQQALASNLLNVGMSLAGLIAYEDLRAAEFLASLPEVDIKRIAAMGLSMGAFRTWQVAALSNSISAGVAICWLATTKGLMVKGNNQTRGQSAFTMTHPGLTRYLDYADVASIACPKPMLFYNGEHDALFPVPSVQETYAKLHKVWESQGASDRLETKLWPVAHVFSREMQDAAFEWLDQHLSPAGARPLPPRAKKTESEER
jgi:dienelactone hydrolase